VFAGHAAALLLRHLITRLVMTGVMLPSRAPERFATTALCGERMPRGLRHDNSAAAPSLRCLAAHLRIAQQ